jgi:CubicO group peptidase (beta-lactamase class C family)
VHGYDTTKYNNNTKAIDVYGVAGVFAGWTASDFVADASDISRFVYDVYSGYSGSGSGLVSEKLVKMMYDTSGYTGYGLATFNLTRRTGQHGADGVAMGHLGATYGYQSVVAYNPAMDFSIAVATNIERDEQDQPADAMCLIYNAVRAIVRGIAPQNCTFTTGYFTGGCKCV